MKIKKINQSAGVVANVVNSLESNSAVDALSAAAGKKLNESIESKVDKIEGKVLSSNDYTDTEKNKLANISEGATKNIVENVLTSSSTTNALSAAQGKKIWDNMNYNVKNTTWAKEYTVNYTHAYVPKIVFLAWEQSEQIYVIYREKLLLIYDGIAEGSSSTITATLDTETNTATFSMSNTGILYTTEFPLTPIESY